MRCHQRRCCSDPACPLLAREQTSAHGCGFNRSTQHLDSLVERRMLPMKRRTRIQYTEADKALMWERWRQGESLHAIARLFNRYHPSIGGILSRLSLIHISEPTRLLSISYAVFCL